MSKPCSVGCGTITSRADGVCETCWRARQLIETSVGAAAFTRIVLDCEKDWALMDRIDWSLGIPIRRSRPTS